MRRPLTLFLLLGLTSSFCSPAFGQDSVAEYRPVPPLVSYEIHGKLDLTHQRLDATSDIDVRPDSMQSSIWLALPGKVDSTGKGKEFSLDSVLINGAPFEYSSHLRQKQLIEIPVRERLPRPHLFLSFSLRLPISVKTLSHSDAFILSKWYPAIVDASDIETRLHPDNVQPAVADYAVEMTADSTVSLAASGGLRNARERFGILPDKGDTVLLDIANSSLDRARSSGATRSYDWQTGPSAGFDIGISARPGIDMAIASGLKLRIYESGRFSKQRQELLAAARKLMASLVLQAGTPTNTEIAAVFSDENFESGRFGNLVVLPAQTRDRDAVIASLAVQLASQYFSPSRLTDSARSMPWTEGAAVYAATAALHSVFGARGFDMMERYGNWIFPRPTLGQPMSRRGPFGWMETVRASRLRWTRADSVRYEALFVIPSALYAIGSLTGEEKIRRALYQYSLQTRNRMPSAVEFVGFMSQRLGDAITPGLFNQWQQYGRRLDWSVQDVTVQRTYTGVVVSGRVRREGLRAMPVEFGVVVPSGDTLSKNIVPDSAAIGSAYMPFSIEVLDQPVALLLDPYHYLPDMKRENNVYIFGSGPVRIKAGIKEYPAFRRLERGE